MPPARGRGYDMLAFIVDIDFKARFQGDFTRRMNLNQVTVPAFDVAASVAFYRCLGLEPIVDEPHYARFKCPDGDATFSVHQVPQPLSASATVVYFETADLDHKVRQLQAAGLVFLQEPRDEPWLWREARLADPAGNIICLYWAGTNRLDPPWRVPR
jgi:predicted enzyme related to lactoylglutathione lyase